MEKPPVKEKKKPFENWSKKMIVTAIIGLAVIVAGVIYGVHFARTVMASQGSEVIQSVTTLQTSLNNVSQTAGKAVQSEKQKEIEAIKVKLRAGQTDGLKVVFLTFDDGPTEHTGEVLDILKVVFLTFDDGPTEHTGEVLDILKQYGIQGTFFSKGNTGDIQEAAMKRIVAEGNTLANHSYSHNYSLYSNPSAFYADVQAQDDYIKRVTGMDPTHIFRFPGGSLNANKTCAQGILDRGYNYADWNVSSGDAAPTTPDVDSIVAAVVGGCQKYSVSVVLCHGELKANTRTALPQIIKNLQDLGYTFLPMEAGYTYPRQLTP